MPLNLDFEFFYPIHPIVTVSLRGTSSGDFVRTGAFLDTGAEVSLFDSSVAARANLDMISGRSVTIAGIAGERLEARLLQVTLRLLHESELEVNLPLAFADLTGGVLGNLIGLDVLEHFDFGLSHHDRLGYLGRAAR